jgi:hypothetical protein
VLKSSQIRSNEISLVSFRNFDRKRANFERLIIELKWISSTLANAAEENVSIDIMAKNNNSCK